VSQPSRLDTVHELRERLQQLERSNRPDRESLHSSGTALDQLLARKGWATGTLIEWVRDQEGSGAATLALAVAAKLLEQGGALVVIDDKREFYPPAAAGLGIPLERTVVVQSQSAGDALWALEQALRSPAVTVALGWIERCADRVFRRLQLAAETGGSFGFLLRPASCRKEHSRAEMRLLVEPARSTGEASGWMLRAAVLHRRGGSAGQVVEVELKHETNPVRLVPGLANSAFPPRAAGA
jgi:hypothetical protein